MEYLKRVLGVQVDYVENVYKCLPNYLISRYEVKKVLLDELPVFFLYVKVDLEPISAVKKHIKQIKKIESIPVVFVLKQMTFYQRENFIKERISFVVENLLHGWVFFVPLVQAVVFFYDIQYVTDLWSWVLD